MNNIRVGNFDILRGLSMIVIISWHTIGEHYKLTDPWVMPSFFIVAGFFWKDVYTREFIDNKYKKILLPYIILSVPVFIIGLIKSFITKDSQFIIDLFNPYKTIMGGGWFIWCILEAYTVYFIIRKYINNKYMRNVIIVLLSLFGFLLDEIEIKGHSVVLPFYFNTALFILIFFHLGYLLKSYRNYLIERNLLFLVISVIVFLGSIFCFKSYPLELIWSDYYGNNWFIVVFQALCGTIGFTLLSNYLTFLSPIKKIGNNSLLILLLHFYVIDLLLFCGLKDKLLLFLLTVVLTYILTNYIVKYKIIDVIINKITNESNSH